MRKKLLVSILLIIAHLGSAEDISCKLCNSADTPACVREPTAVTATCKGEKCYTYLDNATTMRDCTGPAGVTCDETNNCETCDKDLCNIDIYPKGRPSCIQCNNTLDCVTVDSQTPGSLCLKYTKEPECYTYVESATFVIRGCLSDGFDKCKDENCVKCKENNCNRINATSHSTCIECSSDKNKDCKRPEVIGDECKISVTEKCTDVVLLGRKPECFINYDGDTVSRGCQNKKPTTGQTEPSWGDDSNSKCIPDAKCYICNSLKESKCTDANNLAEYSEDCELYVSSCHLCETLDGKATTRGCGLNSESNVICQTCPGNNCNKDEKLPKLCYSCDSKTNAKCATNEDIPTKFCNDSTDECFTMLDSDGTTKRGCKKDLPEDSCKENDTNCKSCNTHKCNTYKFATKPRQCYICQGKDDCIEDQTKVAREATICSKMDDQCYMYSSDNTTMRRGCLSEDGHPEACDQDDLKCVKCGTDACNSKALLGPSGLNCIQCKKENETCAWRFEPKSADSCSKEILYYQRDLCYILDNGSDQVERGCYSDSNICTLENPHCRFCYEDGCNTQSSQKWSCIRCRSSFGGQAKCKNEKPSGFENNCAKVPTAETRGCYVYDYGGVIARGCLSDLDEVDLAKCENAKFKKCDTCKEENCNFGKLKDASSALYVSTALVFYSLVFIFIRL